MWNIKQSPQSLVGKMCEIYWSPQESIETLSMCTQGHGQGQGQQQSQQNQQLKNNGNNSSIKNTSREELNSRQTSTSNWDTSSLSSLTKTTATVTTCSSSSSTSSSSDAPPSPAVTDDDDGDFSNSDADEDDKDNDNGNDNHENTNGYDADWYDAHVKSYSPESSLYDVVFVGEEKIYRMPLSEKVVRPLNENENDNDHGDGAGDGAGESESDAMNTHGSAHSAQHEEINDEWNNYVVGKDWEVYWSTSSSSPSRSARDDNMPLPLPLPLANDFDADWYDARIQSYSRSTNMFQVSFVGEEQVYDMSLCSSVLRPSARAWVRRTRALLDLRAQQVVDEKGCPLSCIAVRRALPQSTERWGEDMSVGVGGGGGAIDRVKDTQRTYLSACPFDQKFDISFFRILLEEQVSLRSHLRFLPPENQDAKTSTNTNTNHRPSEYSEQHVDYMVQCLEHFIEACKWFISNKWSSFSSEMLGSRNGIDHDVPMSKMKIEDIYVRLVDGVLTFVRALLVDASKLSIQRKPSRIPLSIKSINEVPNSHRRKRRRLTQSRHTQTQSKENEFVGKMGRDDELGVLMESIDFEYTTNIESIQGAFKAIMYHLRIESKSETDGGLSVEAIGMLIQKCLHKGNCSRYFVSFISDSLLDTVGHVWECIVSWIDGARKVLGPSRNLVEVQSIENLLTSGTIAIESNQGISDALSETQESIKLRVVQDLATHFNQAHTDKILCRFELKGYQREIEQWVRDVHHFQQSAWEIIARGLMAPIDLPTGSFSYNSTDLYEGDSIILKLKQLVKNPLCLDASESKHIVSPSNAITRQNIDIFIKIRTWMVHCHWILTRKERVVEIETVFRQKPDRIAIPSQYFMIEGKLVSEQIDCLKEKLAATWMKFQELSQHPREVIIQDIKSENSCRQLLASWSSRKVLIDNEERIALLADIFAWNTEARSILSIESGHKKDFDSIRSHFKTFQNLKKGISTTRSALISGLLGNLELDQKMATFSKEVISMHCNDVPCALSTVYNTGMEWERRAKLVLKALIYFGNESVVCSDATSTYNMKVNNLVDLKVIDDLVEEYGGSSWQIPELYNNLCTVRKDAHKWSKDLLSSLHGRHSALHGTAFTSPMQLDGMLQMQCGHRPKGILMFPSRQLTSEWAALLSWYNNCSETFDILVDHHASKSSPTGELSDEVAMNIIEKNREIESLFVTGRELFYAVAENDSACHFDIKITPEEQDSISSTFKCNSPTITLAKIASCEYSQKILESIIGYDLLRKEKGIMFLMKLYLWRYLAMQTLNKLGIQSSKGSKAKNQTKPTLQSTKLLLERVESLPTTLEIISKNNPLVASIYSTKYLTLHQLVAEAEMIELETKNALERVSQYDGSVSEAFVFGSLEELRNIRGKIKSVSDCGLGIAYSLANEVEKRIRDLNWMNSVMSTRIYHLKDETFSSFGQPYRNDRISLMTLLQMSDKAPSHSRSGKGEHVLDIEMVDLYNRIKELKDNCASWQTEVYEYIPRSARVSKRREIQSRHVAEDEELAIITASEIKKLLKTPVTLDVSMPEEDILCDAYFHANILEKSMEDLFSKDDYRVDRKGLPSFESLIGESGEFLLLRTIESNEFEIMKQKMTAMKPTLNNLSVRTPEKLLYKWLLAVLNWIDRFGDALLEPFQPDATMLNKIHLSMEDAKLIIDEGHELFSNISDVSRKHLLKLRVSVFVRNGTGRISIKKCKGGLNHSVGGTVLWWSAFCYNSLRNDMATTLHWSKRAKSFLSKSASISNLLALTGLHKEAEEFLMVAPDEEDIMTKIVETLNENSMPVDEELPVKGSEAENKPGFMHNLFQK